MSKPTHEYHPAPLEGWIEDAAFLGMFFVAAAIVAVIVMLLLVF
jgi:hypothetical protein